jgi:HSP20 family protein
MQSLTLKPQPLSLKPFTTPFFDRSYWDTFFGDVPVTTVTGLPIDVVTGEDSYEIKIHMAGLKKENTSIHLDGRRFTVSYESSEDNSKYYLKESVQQNITRSILLPNDIDETAVSKASYEDGVLKVTIGKLKNKPKTIEIE